MTHPRWSHICTLAAFAALAQPCEVSAQVVRGRLISAEMEMPLSFGTIELLNTRLEVVASAFADALGRFEVSAPGPGSYALRGGHMNAEPLISAGVTLTLDQVVDVELALPLRPFELDPLLVSVRPERRFLVRNGFYERSRSALGTFITPELMERWRPFFPTDMLRRIPGVRLTPDPRWPTRFSITFSRAGLFMNNCQPKIFLDGVMMYGLYINDLPVEDIAAMEVYKSGLQTPPQYASGGSACGAIVIWTGPRLPGGR